MTAPETPRKVGLLADLLHTEGRLVPRLRGVLRLDPEIYAEIEQDPAAIPQAFAVVIATSVLIGFGQGSIAGIFLGTAGALALWLILASLIWAAGTAILGQDPHFARLLRCLGFAYAWFSLLIFSEIPFIGWIFGWGAVALALISLVFATRQVLHASTPQAFGIAAGALVTPFLLLWILSSWA